MMANPRSRDEHLFAACPKRVLSLDGGGVRGIVALAFLERLEAELSSRFGTRHDFRLCHYFDLIGGTSTGSIIATTLAMGYRVADVIELYLSLARRGFHGSRWHGGILVPKFRAKSLMEVLQEHLGDLTLGSDQVKTGLAIIAKRLDTGSLWVFHNNPCGVYFDPPDHDAEAVPNRDLPLASLIRASTAAPTYFAPEEIAVARGVTGAFVDGGVSPFADPALQLFLLTQLKGYGYQWSAGEDRLLLLSVGTGHAPLSAEASALVRANGLTLALTSLKSLIQDGKQVGQTLLQWLGRCPTPHSIDSEIGDLNGDFLSGEKYLHYVRYDIVLQPAWLESKLGVRLTPSKVGELVQMDRPDNMQELLDIARIAADRKLAGTHFPRGFDPVHG